MHFPGTYPEVLCPGLIWVLSVLAGKGDLGTSWASFFPKSVVNPTEPASQVSLHWPVCLHLCDSGPALKPPKPPPAPAPTAPFFPPFHFGRQGFCYCCFCPASSRVLWHMWLLFELLLDRLVNSKQSIRKTWYFPHSYEEVHWLLRFFPFLYCLLPSH